ncbi:hypothetical protein BFF78_38285 [Streptomyces fodineus]|uniref:Uncharacterized protein n=1 Tax=Streptomyces fodineus TaxID=1904616 RepID=A0A1D7YKK5_9ACTN|nr:hypothetical protein [Streptomyces fodineus]AOR36127.1 hypothetical protein BFF78_38285 [Streptomyces fodineus]
MTDVWRAPEPAEVAPAGLVIPVGGAMVPARRAARLTVAEVLRNEQGQFGARNRSGSKKPERAPRS